MAYCEYTDITNLTGTTLSQSIIEAVIAQADREIDGILAPHGLSGSSTGLIKSASIELSIAGIYTRQRMDGKAPNSLTLDGGLSISTNVDAAIEHHRSVGLKYIQDYISYVKRNNEDTWIVVTNG